MTASFQYALAYAMGFNLFSQKLRNISRLFAAVVLCMLMRDTRLSLAYKLNTYLLYAISVGGEETGRETGRE